jgi:hypothetical protein
MPFEIKIYNPKESSSRAYVNIKINGQWIKEYNGNRLGINIKPNLASTLRTRTKLLNQLEYEYRKALESRTYQRLIDTSDQHKIVSVYEALTKALKQKKRSNLTPKYSHALQHSRTTRYLQSDPIERGIIVSTNST